MTVRKTKVFWYKKGCQPRILINPPTTLVNKLKEEGDVLLGNPNEGSVKGLPLEHTFPDVSNNMIRPIPKPLRKPLGKLKNPIAVALREGDDELQETLRQLKNHKIEELLYKEEIQEHIDKAVELHKKELFEQRVMTHVWNLLYIAAFYAIFIKGFPGWTS